MIASVEQFLLLIGRRNFALAVGLVDTIVIADGGLVQHILLLEAVSAAAHVEQFRTVFALRSCSHGLYSWAHIHWL